AADPQRPIGARRTAIEERLHGRCHTRQEVEGLDRAAENETVPSRLELLIPLKFVPVRLVECGVFFLAFGRLPTDEELQVLRMVRRQQTCLAVRVEVQSRLTEIEFLALQSVEEWLDVLPFAFRERRGLNIPSACRSDERLDHRMVYLRNHVP